MPWTCPLHLGRGEVLEEGKVQLVKMVEECSNTELVLCGWLLTSGRQGWYFKFCRLKKIPDNYCILFLSQALICNSGSRCSFIRSYPSSQHLQIPLQFVWALFGNKHLFPLNIHLLPSVPKEADHCWNIPMFQWTQVSSTASPQGAERSHSTSNKLHFEAAVVPWRFIDLSWSTETKWGLEDERGPILSAVGEDGKKILLLWCAGFS